MKADILLQSNFIFNGITDIPFEGSIAIKDNKIISINHSDGLNYVDEHTIIFPLGDKLICPGFVDVHCFFTGHLLKIFGVNLNDCKTPEEVLQVIYKYKKTKKENAPLIGRNINSKFDILDQKLLDSYFGDTPIILFHKNSDSCFMNQAAILAYGFTPQTYSAESAWQLLKEILCETSFSEPAFKEYLYMLNSRGITSIKEMAFDDFWGFTKSLEKLAKNKELTARVNFMSQPVKEPINFKFGENMSARLNSNFLKFSGYNLMTYGSISQMEAEMKSPYSNLKTSCKINIDWKSIETNVLLADNKGFRFSLHAQGDSAISKSIDIFSKCQKSSTGKVLNRHAITDLEHSDPIDLERMGNLGIIAEIYPQIMSLSNRSDKLSMIEKNIGLERGQNYWNRKKLINSSVNISCATDLPLLYPDIPESVYHSVGGMFPEGGLPFNQENTLTLPELLKAWTIGGQYNLGFENILGTLENNKLADITVLDQNIFMLPLDKIREARICLTIVDGKIVYNTL